MKTLVIDASVAAKWFLPIAGEPHADAALDLLKAYVNVDVALTVPDLFWAEIGNIFWKAARQGRWSESDGKTALAAICEQQLSTVPSQFVLEHAYAISAAYDRTVYDSIYVALALASETELVTADERLANALAAYFPVKWLGSWR